MSSPTYAKIISQKQIDFPLQTQEILKGEVPVYFKVMSPKTIEKKYPMIAGIDTLSLRKIKNIHLKVGKAIYVVDKPVGFFNDKDLMKEEFITHYWDTKNLSREEGNAFILNKGLEKFKLTSYFDSDDISTVSSFKISQAISAVKDLDIISKSASVIMVTEKTFKDESLGEVFISSFIPIKENKTIVIHYSLQGIKKPFPKRANLREQFFNEIEQSMKRINSFNID